MEGRIGVQPDSVRGIKDQIGDHQVEIEGILGSLKTLNTELQASWDGSAQATFESTYSGWISKLEAYVGTLESVQAYLESVVVNYEELNAAAQQAASSATTPT